MSAPAATAPAPSDQSFTADWLSLREPLDIAARPVALVRRLAERLPAGRPVGIVDLGCGTGSNVRALAPALDRPQTWRLMDNDPLLLREVPHRMRPWAEARGLVQSWENEDANALLFDDGETIRYRLELEVRDLAGTIDHLDLAGRDLVTCAALMDLVSADWLAALADRVAHAGAAAYFALTYTGDIRFTPVDPLDEEVVALFNLHMRGDKGFGPALGPDAPQRMADAFLARGHQVITEPSDWDAGPDAVPFQRALIEGHARAASEMAREEARPAIAQWRDRRLKAVEAGHGSVRVGHVDLLAHP